MTSTVTKPETSSAPPVAAQPTRSRKGLLERDLHARSRLVWPREESNLRTQLRRLPLCPLSYGAERPKGNPAPRSLRCAGSVAVAQSVELRVVVPVVAGSSPVRHPL